MQFYIIKWQKQFSLEFCSKFQRLTDWMCCNICLDSVLFFLTCYDCHVFASFQALSRFDIIFYFFFLLMSIANNNCCCRFFSSKLQICQQEDKTRRLWSSFNSSGVLGIGEQECKEHYNHLQQFLKSSGSKTRKSNALCSWLWLSADIFFLLELDFLVICPARIPDCFLNVFFSSQFSYGCFCSSLVFCSDFKCLLQMEQMASCHDVFEQQP